MAERKREIRWTERAWNELLQTLRFYDDRNRSPGYSAKIESLVWKKLELISSYPEMSEVYRDGPTRYAVIKTFVLLYAVVDDAIVVQAFRDARREPEV